jgi:hypothetical protein
MRIYGYRFTVKGILKMKTELKTNQIIRFGLNILLVILFVGIAQTNSFAGKTFEEVDLDNDIRWDVVYEGSTYDADANTTTFSYKVIVNDDPALSHFTVGFELCDTEMAVVSYNPNPEEGVSIGLDPTTGVYGIKWDIPLEPGNDQIYSVTLQGNVAETEIDVAVKAATFAAIAKRPGPSCNTISTPNTYNIGGTVFMDVNKNGADDGEPPLANVTVDLVDPGGNIIASVTTNENGEYIFSDIPEGNYTVMIPDVTGDSIEDFNENLDAYFDPTSALNKPVDLNGADSNGNDFGFHLDTIAVLDDLNDSDPDGDGFTFAGNGKTIGFWKHQHQVALKGKGRAHVDAATLQSYLDNIENMYLVDPFQLNDLNEFQAAFDILSSKSSDMTDLLMKQLMGTELNHISGRGLTAFMDLQGILIYWAEHMVANNGDYTREALEDIKDIMDMINNTGN